jgi:hypothetical protein
VWFVTLIVRCCGVVWRLLRLVRVAGWMIWQLLLVLPHLFT